MTLLLADNAGDATQTLDLARTVKVGPDTGVATAALGDTTVTHGTSGANAQVSTMSPKYGSRCYQVTSGSDGGYARIEYFNGSAVDVGGRAVFWINLVDAPANQTVIAAWRSSGDGTAFAIRYLTGGTIQLWNAGSTMGAAGSATLSTGTWYRLAVGWTITTTTNWAVKVYVDGTIDLNRTNADGTLGTTLGTTGKIVLGFGSTQAANTSKTMRVDNVFADDTTDLTDPGDYRVTTKFVTGSPTSSWDTQVGTGSISERPLDGTGANGWRQNGATQADHVYALQAATAGDDNLAGASYFGRVVWALMSRPSGTVGTGATAVIYDGAASAVTVPTTLDKGAILWAAGGSVASYPTGSFGARSTGNADDTALWEFGVQFVYQPGGGRGTASGRGAASGRSAAAGRAAASGRGLAA